MTTADPFAPYTGFGDDYQTSAKFIILHPDTTFPQWSSAPILTRHHVYNSNTHQVQMHGREMWRVSLRLMFESVEELEFFDAFVGSSATLRYRAGLGKKVGGVRESIHGVDYLKLENTILSDVSDERYEIDGPCEVTATFERGVV